MARDVADMPAVAEAAGLVYVDDRDPGITRHGTPRGIEYRGPDGKPIKKPAEIERLNKLAIPPAWTEVWICPLPNGHIQATGRDVKGRKQYRYHEEWRQVRDGAKYERMIAFGRALPRLRRRVQADLGKRGLPREKVLAGVVALLEMTLIRVGNDEYARQNKSYGLTTLQKRHVRMAGGKAVFRFKGKSGKEHQTGFSDRRLICLIRACQDLPGQRLFKYIDEDGEAQAVTSNDVNAYLREAMGGEFTAKDFRTWAGTLAAAKALCMQGPAETATATKQTVATCVKAVAGLLGNTPAVCRSAYIHPGIIEAYEKGELGERFGKNANAGEGALLRFLKAAAAAA
ncbi:MAG TPA: DNA topoisomerase IB [Caulobacteraceae bacterium]|nr:DNA topoisomerase IB [Caulobacteraceae bacterium]